MHTFRSLTHLRNTVDVGIVALDGMSSSPLFVAPPHASPDAPLVTFITWNWESFNPKFECWKQSWLRSAASRLYFKLNAMPWLTRTTHEIHQFRLSQLTSFITKKYKKSCVSVVSGTSTSNDVFGRFSCCVREVCFWRSVRQTSVFNFQFIYISGIAMRITIKS